MHSSYRDLTPICLDFMRASWVPFMRCFFVRGKTDSTLLLLAREVLDEYCGNKRDWMQYSEDDSNNLLNTSLSGKLGNKKRTQTYMGIGSGPPSHIDTVTHVAPRHHTQS